MKAEATHLGEAFEKAFHYANSQHSGQTRKGTEIPYICHPLAVAALVLEAGGDESQVIAGMLHDVVEDCGGQVRLQEIKLHFGSRVAQIVEECSDSMTADPSNKEPWTPRKARFLLNLRTVSPDAILVTAADKAHNAQATVTDVERFGPSTLKRFCAEPDQILVYYESLLNVLRAREGPDVLLLRLEVSIKRLRDLVDGEAHRSTTARYAVASK